MPETSGTSVNDAVAGEATGAPAKLAIAPIERIERIGIVGAGTMGHGIAQVAVASGHHVVLADTAPAALERGMAQVAKGLSRLVDKGKLPAAERDQALSRLAPAHDLAAFAGVDLAVEAVVEKLEVKQRVL